MANRKEDVQQLKVEEQEQIEQAPIKYFHVDEFLSDRVEKLPTEIVNGFKRFLKGRLYQTSLDGFEKDLKAFYERFNKKD